MNLSSAIVELPSANHVEPAVLARIFRATTNSYKYLFFQAILRQAGELGTLSPPRLAVRALISSALDIAWYPLTYCHLNFGAQDQFAQVIQDLMLGDEHVWPRAAGAASAQDRHAIATRLSDAQVRSLARWVPYRLLTPWFEAQLRGCRDSAKNARIEQLSQAEFAVARPLYRLEDDGAFVQIHPDWWVYLRSNFAVVSDWSRWQWLTFLQQRNPTALNISQKLEAPEDRVSLSKQRGFWVEAIARSETRCIYSGKVLTSPESLDHFMPWSFMANDASWNLIPVSTSANSSKRDSVPDLEAYLPGLIAGHARALASSVEWMGEKQREGLLAEYADGLRVPLRDLRADLPNALGAGYREMMPTLAALARSQGFPVGWRLGG